MSIAVLQRIVGEVFGHIPPTKPEYGAATEIEIYQNLDDFAGVLKEIDESIRREGGTYPSWG